MLCISLSFPPLFTKYVLFVERLHIFYVLFCLYVLWFTSLSLPHVFTKYFCFNFERLYMFYVLCFWTPCFANHMFDPCFAAANFLALHFSQDRHITVTAKPLQTFTANTPGVLQATTRTLPFWQVFPLPLHLYNSNSLQGNPQSVPTQTSY